MREASCCIFLEIGVLRSSSISAALTASHRFLNSTASCLESILLGECFMMTHYTMSSIKILAISYWGKKKAPDRLTIRGLATFGGGGGTAFPLLSEWAGLCLHPNPLSPFRKGGKGNRDGGRLIFKKEILMPAPLLK